jgi:hypothetical protein
MSDSGDHQQSPAGRATSGESDTRRSSRRFRFKLKPSSRHSKEDLRHSPASTTHGSHHKHHSHHRHHRHKRRRPSTSPSPNSLSPHDNATASNLHPDIAFRESLFDAMGDDEGAAYWESVYGQPIHTYPNEKRNEETGELEKMTDEEYIAFVRRGMWERSWEGVEAEREQRRKEKLREERVRERGEGKRRRRGERATGSGAGAAAGCFEWEVEESLRRGLQRKEVKMWREKWRAYEKRWDELYELARSRNAASKTPEEGETACLRNEIVWPVESGKRKDVSPQQIERFMLETARSLTATDQPEDEPNRVLSNLKIERVRWHPDKVQQRFGSLDIDGGTLKGVTEVFQVMDQLYNERK